MEQFDCVLLTDHEAFGGKDCLVLYKGEHENEVIIPMPSWEVGLIVQSMIAERFPHMGENIL